MTQPGWHPDPHGSGGHRWWDGTQWTQHVQHARPPVPAGAPAPSTPPAPAGHSTPVAQPQEPVLNQKFSGRQVYGDPRMISQDGVSIELAHVQWVCYWAVQRRMRGLFGIGTIGVEADWHFQVGRYPFKQAPMVALGYGTMSIKKEHEVWTFMVNLSRTYLEPRLVAELVARVLNGETVNVGEGIQVHRGGFYGGGVALPWASVAGTSNSGGKVWIHQVGKDKAVLSVPQQNPNAVLVPQLFSTLAKG